jgi:two-component system response regulator DevR
MAKGVTGHEGDGRAGLDEDDTRLLALLTEGLTNQEIAERVGTTEEGVGFDLQKMFAKIGASSRVDATVFALREGVL